MAEPVTTTTEQDDVILRFLAAADMRRNVYGGRIQLNPKGAAIAMSWLRGLVGKINDDGSLIGNQGEQP
jgi:hypothetical protein